MEISKFHDQQELSNNGSYRDRKNSDFLEEADLELSMNFEDSQQEFVPYESVKRFLNEDVYNDNITGKNIRLIKNKKYQTRLFKNH